MVCDNCKNNIHIKCVAVVRKQHTWCDCQHGGDDPEALKEDCCD